MSKKRNPRRLSRREFLRFGGGGALTVLAGGTFLLPGILRRSGKVQATSASLPARPASMAPVSAAPTAGPVVIHRRLVATDGFIKLPGRADPLYIFGFREVHAAEVNQINPAVSPATPVQDISVADLTQRYKGRVQTSAPILDVDEFVRDPLDNISGLYLTVTNLGLVHRPDLDDAHTLHWHGFRNPISLFDGVPEVSVSVPPGRDFPYFFRPHDAGTYMYHCHFEDVEHVQMGMNGIVYVRPLQNGDTSLYPSGKFAYNDGDGSTGYDREYTLMLNEIDTRPHDNLIAVQEFLWTNYKANYWVINGRAYPDTVKASHDPSLIIPETGEVGQPISSLIQANPGERILLRFTNLGYEQHAMQLPGIRMKVVGHDATLLRNPPNPPFGPNPVDLTYETNTVYIGPGEARDVLFTAPAYDASRNQTDSRGDHNVYWLKNRNYNALNNGGQVDPATGLGGMVTEVRVYKDDLPDQTEPNQVWL
ncbi:MAG: hypothetical protein D6791_14640 [Chloroflexi bacterium]|nr:MAG: hypothetical protein D6791_14640 [Chloroflexota bacterium]